MARIFRDFAKWFLLLTVQTSVMPFTVDIHVNIYRVGAVTRIYWNLHSRACLPGSFRRCWIQYQGLCNMQQPKYMFVFPRIRIAAPIEFCWLKSLLATTSWIHFEIVWSYCSKTDVYLNCTGIQKLQFVSRIIKTIRLMLFWEIVDDKSENYAKQI